ncbi:MAG: 4a-hydroxytetrahydrobiopterin dehydratase [Gammaproteobacteria bacterium]|nr:4a-hydroxytetrahydrobiopterin dehydratase [Gammaproteobacteria bacterium]MCY4218875.1 4a-hydroxytetrahydrobiopterin dehydratase [Gammaproteobacteria bacterium]MCY4274257.1 4a-hydroxytetrahydrobiopterin dehydratase [Gammaproteobacteria bacterium]
MSRELLDQQAIKNAITILNLQSSGGWIYDDNKLCRKFMFKNFIQAMGFMMSAAIVSERMNHHPEWSNVYKTVEVALTTHSSGGVTQLDVDLAQQMEELAQPYFA